MRTGIVTDVRPTELFIQAVEIGKAAAFEQLNIFRRLGLRGVDVLTLLLIPTSSSSQSFLLSFISSCTRVTFNC